MAKEKIATQVHDFIALPLHIPAVPSLPRESTHYLYLRANAPRVPTDDTPREVFLVNVPVDATETHVRSLFAEQLGGGRVDDIEWEDARVGKGIKAPVIHAESKRGKKRKRDAEGQGKAEADAEEVGLLPDIWDRNLHRSGGTAVVRFVDRASAEIALREARRAIKSKSSITWPPSNNSHPSIPPLGSSRYLTHHRLRYPDHSQLQFSIEAFMAAFTAQETEHARQLAKQRSVPDEDGFITVTRGGRNAPASEEQTKAKEEELKKREKNRVKEDFYRFQVREKKKEHARDLVRGFEEDRRKVDALRRRRGRLFQPG